MARSKREDGPTITMLVERGRLVPFAQYDAERLDSFRMGAEVEVKIRYTKTRPLQRRYWAMLTKLMEVTETDWKSDVIAHNWLKEFFGFFEPEHQEDGSYKKKPISMTDFTDGELKEFFELFCGLVQERYGIDPETLGKEAPDTGYTRSEAPAALASDAPDPSTTPADHPEPPSTDSPPAPVGGTPLANGDWAKLASRMLIAATAPKGDVDVLKRQAAAIKHYHTPEHISAEARGIITKVYKECLEVTANGGKLDMKLISTMIGCKPRDLKP